MKGCDSMDPRKNFICPAGKHVINDTQRRWGAQSECAQCLFETYIEEAVNKEGGSGQDETERIIRILKGNISKI